MATNIEKQVEKTIQEQASKFSKSKTIKDYEKAAERFEEMVKKGLTKKRGFTLMTIDNSHLHRMRINSK